MSYNFQQIFIQLSFNFPQYYHMRVVIVIVIVRSPYIRLGSRLELDGKLFDR